MAYRPSHGKRPDPQLFVPVESQRRLYRQRDFGRRGRRERAHVRRRQRHLFQIEPRPRRLYRRCLRLRRGGRQRAQDPRAFRTGLQIGEPGEPSHGVPRVRNRGCTGPVGREGRHRHPGIRRYARTRRDHQPVDPGVDPRTGDRPECRRHHPVGGHDQR